MCGFIITSCNVLSLHGVVLSLHVWFYHYMVCFIITCVVLSLHVMVLSLHGKF